MVKMGCNSHCLLVRILQIMTLTNYCSLSGYRHIRLLSNTGEPIENCSLFIHVAITNKRGGGVSTHVLIKHVSLCRTFESGQMAFILHTCIFFVTRFFTLYHIVPLVSLTLETHFSQRTVLTYLLYVKVYFNLKPSKSVSNPCGIKFKLYNYISYI